MLLRYVYTSVATHPFAVNPDLPRILSVGRRNNATLGISGFLLHGDGMFAQCLEGDGDAIAALTQRIDVDPAHGALRVLQIVTCSKRLFSDFDLGFHVPQSRDDRLQLSEVLRSGDFEAIFGQLLKGRDVALQLRDSKVTLLQSFRELPPQAADQVV